MVRPVIRDQPPPTPGSVWHEIVTTVDPVARAALSLQRSAEAWDALVGLPRLPQTTELHGHSYRVLPSRPETIQSGNSHGFALLLEVERDGVLVFRDRVQMWGRAPILTADGTFNRSFQDGIEILAPNFHENRLAALLSDLVHTAYVVTLGGPHIKSRPGTVSTFHPDPHTETTSVDGWVNAAPGGLGDTWANVQGGAGSTADDSTASVNTVVQIKTTSTTNNYDKISRGIALFDTSAVDDTDTKDSAVLSWRGVANFNGWSGPSWTLNVYTSAPASNTALVAGDFDSLGTVAQAASAIAIGSWITNGFNNFTLNATGLGNIDLTGITKFGLREATHDAPNSEPTWESNVNMFVGHRMAEQTGTDQDPKLVLTHTAGGGAQTISPSPKSIPSALPAITISGSGAATITPTPNTAPTSIPTASVSGSGAATLTATPDTIPATVPTHAISGSGTVALTPTPTTIPTTIPTTTISGSGAVTFLPTPVTVPTTQPTHSISGSGTTTLTPASLTIPSVIPDTSIANASGPQTITAPVVAATSVVAAASVSGSGAATLVSTPTTAPAIIPTHSISGSGATPITPPVVVVAASSVASSISGSGTTILTPSAVAAAFTVALASVSPTGSATVTPASLILLTTVVTALIAGNGAATPITPVPVTMVVGWPTAEIQRVGGPTVITISTTLNGVKALAVTLDGVRDLTATLGGE